MKEVEEEEEEEGEEEGKPVKRRKRGGDGGGEIEMGRILCSVGWEEVIEYEED